MKESPALPSRHLFPLGAIIAVFVVIMACLALFVGCGTGGNNSVSSTGSNAGEGTASPSAPVPLQNEKLDLLTEDEKTGNGMAACYLGELGKSLYTKTLTRNSRTHRASG